MTARSRPIFDLRQKVADICLCVPITLDVALHVYFVMSDPWKKIVTETTKYDNEEYV